MSNQDSSQLNFWPARIIAALIIFAVIGSMGFAQIESEKESRKSLEDRFVVRASSAASFLDSYVQDILLKEQELAKARLGTPEITHDQFLDFLQNFGFGPSVLLDSDGYLIDVAPTDKDLIGTQISTKYDHLQNALNGELNVSNVVPSAALQFPIVAFAVPFESQVGTRVISGAFDLTTQPLGIFLKNAIPFPNSGAYLIDANDTIIASSDEATGTISDVDFELKSLPNGSGTVDITLDNGKKAFVATEPVEGTPWRVVITVESSTLFKPVSGLDRILPWIFIISFAGAAVALIIMLVRGRERRLRLQNVALIDLLTGIYNPRGIKSHLTSLVSAARRHQNDLTIFKIDIDNFDAFNNKFGRNIGDEILQNISKEIQKRLRTEDIVGRSGGEEFMVVLPETDANGANIVAERIRRGVEEDVRPEGTSEAAVTISIGIASFEKDDTADTLSKRATDTLLESKASGKNKVSTSTESKVSIK